MFKNNCRKKWCARKVMALTLVGMLFMSGSAMAYTYSAHTKDRVFLGKGGEKGYIGEGRTIYGEYRARLKVTESSHPVCGDYPLYFRLRSKRIITNPTYVSGLAKVTKLNYPVTMTVTKKDALKDGHYYIYGQTDSSSHCGTKIHCSWEF